MLTLTRFLFWLNVFCTSVNLHCIYFVACTFSNPLAPSVQRALEQQFCKGLDYRPGRERKQRNETWTKSQLNVSISMDTDWTKPMWSSTRNRSYEVSTCFIDSLKLIKNHKAPCVAQFGKNSCPRESCRVGEDSKFLRFCCANLTHPNFYPSSHLMDNLFNPPMR